MSRAKKVIAAISIVAVILIGIVAYLALWTGSTKDIEAVADKFQPGESWTLVSERIEPPRYICLNGGTCPSVSKTWTSPHAITKSQFLKLIPSEYNIREVTGNCPEVLPDEITKQYDCLASGALNKYGVDIIYSINPERDEKYRLTINIRKELE